MTDDEAYYLGIGMSEDTDCQGDHVEVGFSSW